MNPEHHLMPKMFEMLKKMKGTSKGHRMAFSSRKMG